MKNTKNCTQKTGMTLPKKQWYTVPEIAQVFNVSESLVRKFIRNQKLLHHRVGKKILVRISEFEESVMQTFEPNTVSGKENGGKKCNQIPSNENEHEEVQDQC